MRDPILLPLVKFVCENFLGTSSQPPLSSRLPDEAASHRSTASYAILDNPECKVLEGDNTSFSPAPAPPLDNEDLLQEILLRLPPQPSSLPRASLVCTRWRNILSDPEFLERFRKHHQKPPLLGFFVGPSGGRPNFVPNLGSKSDRVPAADRFAVPKSNWDFRGCRHGLAVLLNKPRREVAVWDPLTGQRRRVPFPPGPRDNERELVWNHVTAMCADAEDGHVHGDCFSSPFKLVLTCGIYTQAFACLYKSTSGVWGNIVSTATTSAIIQMRPNIVIGDAVYALLSRGDSLVFDTQRQTLGVIEKPAVADVHINSSWFFQLLRTEDGRGLGFAVLSNLCVHLWDWKMDSDGVSAGWVRQQKIIQLEELFPKVTPRDGKWALLTGYDEDTNAIVLTTWIGNFMLELESTQITTISGTNDNCYMLFYPYANFYTVGRDVGWELLDLIL